MTAAHLEAVVPGEQGSAGADDLHPVTLVDVDAGAVLHGDGHPEVRGIVRPVRREPAVVLVPPDEARAVVVATQAVAEVGDLTLPDLLTGVVEPDHVHGVARARRPAAQWP